MFFEELIPHIEKTYRARSNKEFRAIAGLSMGGYGSFLYTLHHPDMFSACAPLSAAIFDDSVMERRQAESHKDLFGRLFGPGLDYWHKNSVLKMLSELKHEFRVRGGGHTWLYWRTALPNVLEFVSGAFRRNQ